MLETKRGTILSTVFIVSLGLALSPPVQAVWLEDHKILSPLIDTEGGFANGPALDGNTLFVGQGGGGSQTGKVHVYDNSGGGAFSFVETLTGSLGGAEDIFGSSSAIDGTTALIGAPDTGSGGLAGLAYIFDESGGTWNETKDLSASDQVSGNWFGFSTALAGNRAIVGAIRQPPSDSGAAYVFEDSGGGWSQTAKISPPVASQFFGYDIFYDGVDMAVITAPFDSGPAGDAFVYQNQGGTWTKIQDINGTQPANGGAGIPAGEFGRSIAGDGNTIVIGATREIDSSGTMVSGAAHVYERVGNTWNETQVLNPSTAANFMDFGRNVAVQGDILIVGTEDDTGSARNGTAYVFEKIEGTWTETQILSASDGQGNDLFGFDLALDGDTLVVAAPFHNDPSGPSENDGAVYVFKNFATAPTSFTWNGGSGPWNELANWSPALGPPQTNEHTAILGDSILATETVFTNTAVTVKSIEFNDDNTYVVGGGGSVELEADSGNASVNVTQGSHEFQVRVNLVSDTDVMVSSGANLEFVHRLNLNGRTLTKSGGGTLTISNTLNTGGGMFDCSEGTCNGSGTISGDVNNGGTISPGNSPGVWEITGDYSQNAEGELLMEISGTALGDEHDQLIVGGTAELGGTLQVELLDGFQPSLGNSFELFDIGEVVGTFDQVELPALSAGLAWDDSGLYAAGSLSVTAIPEPEAMAMLVLSTVSLLLFWRSSPDIEQIMRFKCLTG